MYIFLDLALGEKYRIFPPRFFKITWENARRNCQNIGVGWDLVKIQSRAEDLLVKDMLKCEKGSYHLIFYVTRFSNG
jgi:hypothetical protein